MARMEQHLDGADHLNVRPFHFELERHLKEPRRSRIARMESMPESWQRVSGFVPAIDDFRCGIPVRGSAPHELEPCIEKGHAALDVAAMIAAESEHACGHARAEGSAGCCRVTGGQR